MFIIDINYIVPLEEIDKHSDAHIEYLKKYFEKNVFIVSGRKEPRTGGIVLALADSRQEVEKIAAEDPFYQYKLSEVTITEFTHARHNSLLDELLGNTV